MLPPPPFKGYVRGITAKTTEDLMHELQAEGRRLREAMPEDLDMNDHQEDAYVRRQLSPQLSLTSLEIQLRNRH
jgi:hypothetical protein